MRRTNRGWSQQLGLLAFLLATTAIERSSGADPRIPGPTLLDAGAGVRPWSFTLTPPSIVASAAPARPPEGGQSYWSLPHLRAAALPVSVTLRYLGVAVLGELRPGMSAYIGTSTTALGGLRIRF